MFLGNVNKVSIIGNKGIVTNGLNMYLDAGISSSYPGTGTTWYDISGNGNNGTLVGGVGYSSSNAGYLIFDGSNDYIRLPNNLLVHNTGNPFTLSLWFKTSSDGIILGQQNTSTPNSANGYVPGIYVGANGLLYTSCFWGGATSNISVSSSTVNNGSWHNVTVTFASGSQGSYLNGISYATLAKTQTYYAGTYYYFIATGRSAGWPSDPGVPYLNSNISSAFYYSRALSPQEIKQNYNALKGRYGL